MNKKKKLLMYLWFPYNPRLETELEIADLHIIKGYDVTLLACMGGVMACPINPKHYKFKCLICTSRLKSGHNWLGKDRAKLKRVCDVTDKQQTKIDTILTEPINCWEELRSIKLHGDDIGEAAFSELVSHIRETHPDFNKYIRYAKKLLNNALIVHFSILNHLKKEKPDKFILFNGRISAYRPALRVGVSRGINTQVMEGHFSNVNKYILTNGTYPHNPNAIAKLILTAHNKTTITEKEKNKLASKWYKDRENGSGDTQFSFTQKQVKGYGIDEIKHEKALKIGIFVSSEDEFLCISERKSRFYKDQNDAISRIINDLKNEKILFVVRAHPHLIRLNNTQIKGLKRVCESKNNIKYTPPESKVSTYELIDVCDIILVFGSTVGIEAVHKNKPTILMGAAIYRGFGGTIEPKTHKELIKILKESAKLGHVSKKYMPAKKAMQRAATLYAFGLLEAGTEKKYQKLRKIFKKSWIEKNGVRTYIHPHTAYRIIDGFYRLARFIKRRVRKI